MKILVINGPNLNMLGIREPGIYGSENYNSLLEKISAHAKEKNVEVDFYQSNHEGALVDAVKAVGISTVEVHISDVSKREDFRQISYIRLGCVASVIGHGTDGYLEAMDILLERGENS